MVKKDKLGKDFEEFCKEIPAPFNAAARINTRLVRARFSGPSDTPFEGGTYVIDVEFPENYPFQPPDFTMRTPNGRFYVNRKICTSASGFHPEDWNPAYTLTSLLVSFVAFMNQDERRGIAAVENPSAAEQRRLAAESDRYNREHGLYSEFGEDSDEAIKPQPVPAEAIKPQPVPAEAIKPQPVPAEAIATLIQTWLWGVDLVQFYWNTGIFLICAFFAAMMYNRTFRPDGHQYIMHFLNAAVIVAGIKQREGLRKLLEDLEKGRSIRINPAVHTLLLIYFSMAWMFFFCSR